MLYGAEIWAKAMERNDLRLKLASALRIISRYYTILEAAATRECTTNTTVSYGETGILPVKERRNGSA